MHAHTMEFNISAVSLTENLSSQNRDESRFLLMSFWSMCQREVSCLWVFIAQSCVACPPQLGIIILVCSNIIFPSTESYTWILSLVTIYLKCKVIYFESSTYIILSGLCISYGLLTVTRRFTSGYVNISSYYSLYCCILIALLLNVLKLFVNTFDNNKQNSVLLFLNLSVALVES